MFFKPPRVHIQRTIALVRYHGHRSGNMLIAFRTVILSPLRLKHRQQRTLAAAAAGFDFVVVFVSSPVAPPQRCALTATIVPLDVLSEALLARTVLVVLSFVLAVVVVAALSVHVVAVVEVVVVVVSQAAAPPPLLLHPSTQAHSPVALAKYDVLPCSATKRMDDDSADCYGCGC